VPALALCQLAEGTASLSEECLTSTFLPAEECHGGWCKPFQAARHLQEMQTRGRKRNPARRWFLPQVLLLAEREQLAHLSYLRVPMGTQKGSVTANFGTGMYVKNF